MRRAKSVSSLVICAWVNTGSGLGLETFGASCSPSTGGVCAEEVAAVLEAAGVPEAAETAAERAPFLAPQVHTLEPRNL